MSKSDFEREIADNGVLYYTVSGLSMLPLLHPHSDIVVIRKPNGRLKKYDVALYKIPDGRYVLHRIIKVRDKDYVICGDHCIRKEYGISDDNIIGVMTEFVRKGKTHSVDAAAYRLYSHFITDFYRIKVAYLWSGRAVLGFMRKIKRIFSLTSALRRGKMR